MNWAQFKDPHYDLFSWCCGSMLIYNTRDRTFEYSLFAKKSTNSVDSLEFI